MNCESLLQVPWLQAHKPPPLICQDHKAATKWARLPRTHRTHITKQKLFFLFREKKNLTAKEVAESMCANIDSVRSALQVFASQGYATYVSAMIDARKTNVYTRTDKQPN